MPNTLRRLLIALRLSRPQNGGALAYAPVLLAPPSQAGPLLARVTRPTGLPSAGHRLRSAGASGAFGFAKRTPAAPPATTPRRRRSAAADSPVHVSRLEPTHAVRYRTLMLEAYTQAADAFTSTAEERAGEPESFWVHRIADPAGLNVAFGAFDGDELIGTVALECSAKPKTRHKGLVIGMVVTPPARGQGTGAALLQALLAHAWAREGLRVLTLTVTEGNEPAERLYRRFGFQPFGVEPMAILTPSGFQSKVHLWLPLQSTGG